MEVIKGDKENNKDETNNETKEYIRVYLELSKTDIYYIQIDIPKIKYKDEKEKIEVVSKENLKAIESAWNIINNKLIDIENIRIGSAFQQKILKRELIKEK